MAVQPVQPDELTRLLMLNAQRPLTVHDLPAGDRRFGLIDGELFVVPATADGPHRQLVEELVGQLLARAGDGAGDMPPNLDVCSGVKVVESEHTIFVPDVMVVDPDFLVHNDLGVAPRGLRLVIEIGSPATRRHDLVDKRELYERWGVPFIFVDLEPRPLEIRIFGDLPPWAEDLL